MVKVFFFLFETGSCCVIYAGLDYVAQACSKIKMILVLQHH